ncbi:MAG: tetratricopeptide repeat protein [Candidatus Eremiobacterota bacterium]
MSDAAWLVHELGFTGPPGNLEEAYVRERLNAHPVAELHAYVLALVASSVAADASYLKIQNDSDDFILLRDGRTPSEEDLQGLFSQLFRHAASPERRYLVDLAVGLNGSLALNPKSVILETTGHRYQLLPLSHKLEPLKASPFQDPRATFRIHVKEPRRLMKLVKYVTGFPPEGELIQKHCLYATPKITVNGVAINRKVDLGRCVVSSRWNRPGVPMPGESVVPGSIARDGTAPGPFASCLGLGRPSEEFRLLYMADGLAFPDPTPDLPFVELRGLVSCPGLRRRLDQTGLIEDEAWSALIEQLRVQVIEMAETAASRFEELDAQTQLTAASILEQLADLAAQNGQLERARGLLTRVVATRERAMRPDDPRLTETFLKLARWLGELDQLEEAARVYRRVLPHLDAQAQHHLSRRNMSQAYEILENALNVHEKIAPPGDPALGKRAFDLAEMLRSEQATRAETLYYRALHLREEALGSDHPEVGVTLLALAELNRLQRDWKGAEGYARRALDIAERHWSRDGKALFPYLHMMSEVLKGMGEYGASLEFSERALMAKHGRL